MPNSTSNPPNESEFDQLKEKGNTAFKEGKYMEAILLYSQAVKLDPKAYQLYSNRSAAFLKMQQYYHAHDDAIETIRLMPTWAKGYFRKGEVESATYNFTDALLSYRCALELQPGDPVVSEALTRATLAMNNEKRANEQVPWLGAGVGIVIGVCIVLADQVTASPAISHPMLMAVLTIAIALIGFALAKAYRCYVDCQRKGLLDPPPDLLHEKQGSDEEASQTPNSDKHTYQRSTKAQARLKLRKGKT